jgi:HEAT repeat protein
MSSGVRSSEGKRGSRERCPAGAPAGFSARISLALLLGLFVLPLALLSLGGCGSTPKPRRIEAGTDLHHPDPKRRTRAVQDVAARHDAARIPDLIELLDDRDDSVRLVAAGALTELTGRESDYRPFAPRAQRLESQDAWRAWYESRGRVQESQP